MSETQPVKMATHGELSAFNSAKEHWTAYIERACYYFITNEVKSDEKKCAILFLAVDLRPTRQFAA